MFLSYRTSDAGDAETHFLTRYRQLYACMLQDTVLGRIGRRGVRLRDKDGCQTT